MLVELKGQGSVARDTFPNTIYDVESVKVLYAMIPLMQDTLPGKGHIRTGQDLEAQIDGVAYNGNGKVTVQGEDAANTLGYMLGSDGSTINLHAPPIRMILEVNGIAFNGTGTDHPYFTLMHSKLPGDILTTDTPNITWDIRGEDITSLGVRIVDAVTGQQYDTKGFAWYVRLDLVNGRDHHAIPKGAFIKDSKVIPWGDIVTFILLIVFIIATVITARGLLQSTRARQAS